jgi:hypothetical protein
MDQPKMPTLKDSQKPQVKVRGLAGGTSLMDRMKQFKKKDLAFILAGLGTLFMAPLAEHFMMSPENGDAAGGMAPGGGGGNGNGIFGVDRGGGGGDGTAPGGPAGSGSDVITPLNVRDPSNLIMGPGASQQPPTNSVAASAPSGTASSSRSDSDVRDALAGSAVRGATSAISHAPLPVPKIGLSGSSLRGLGVATGGSSSNAGPIGAPAPAAFGRSSAGSNMPGVKGGGNIGALTRGQTSSGGGLDALKAAADKAGGVMDRAGSAGSALQAAASQAIPSGGGVDSSGNGAGGSGAASKGAGDNSAKESKSTGESLAYQLMKENLEKQLALYWKEKEEMDPTLELYKLRNSALESIVGSAAGAVGTQINTMLGNFFSGSGPFIVMCMDGTGNVAYNGTPGKSYNSTCNNATGGQNGTPANSASTFFNASIKNVSTCGAPSAPLYPGSTCAVASGSSLPTTLVRGEKQATCVGGNSSCPSAGAQLQSQPVSGLAGACTDLAQFAAKGEGADWASIQASVKPLIQAGNQLAHLAQDLNGPGTPAAGVCEQEGKTEPTSPSTNGILTDQNNILQTLINSQLPAMRSALAEQDSPKPENIPVTDVQRTVALIASVEKNLAGAEMDFASIQKPAAPSSIDFSKHVPDKDNIKKLQGDVETIQKSYDSIQAVLQNTARPIQTDLDGKPAAGISGNSAQGTGLAGRLQVAVGASQDNAQGSSQGGGTLTTVVTDDASYVTGVVNPITKVKPTPTDAVTQKPLTLAQPFDTVDGATPKAAALPIPSPIKTVGDIGVLANSLKQPTPAGPGPTQDLVDRVRQAVNDNRNKQTAELNEIQQHVVADQGKMTPGLNQTASH